MGGREGRKEDGKCYLTKTKNHRKERAELERFGWVWRVESTRRGDKGHAE